MAEPVDGPISSTRSWYWLVAIAAIGVVLRVNHFAGLRELWLDELWLIENFTTRSYAELRLPLMNDQMAPYGFLALLKWIGDSFGYSEVTMRLPMLVVGIASLGLFVMLARRTLEPAAAALAVFLYAISNWLIYYSAEAKQYGFDPLAAIALYLAALAILRRWTPARLAALAVLGAVIVWFSHPSAFVIAGIGLVLAGREWGAGRKGRATIAIAICVPALASFVTHLLFTSAVASSEVVQHMRSIYWNDNFMPLPPRSLSDMRWFPDHFLRLFRTPGGFEVDGLAAVLAAVGCASLYFRQQALMWLLVLPLTVALLASGIDLYPFTTRFLLFSVPAMLLLIAEGLSVATAAAWRRARPLAAAIVAIALVYPLASTARQAFAPMPYTRENLRDLLPAVRERYREGDQIYVYYAAAPAYRFYAPRFGLGDARYVVGHEPGENFSDFFADVDALGCRGRVWVLFSHVARAETNEEKVLVAALDRVGTRAFEKRSLEFPLQPGYNGGSIYLYELGAGASAATSCAR